MDELLCSRRVLLSRVAVALHRPLGREQTFNTDGTSGVNPPGGDPNLGSYKGNSTIAITTVTADGSAALLLNTQLLLS